MNIVFITFGDIGSCDEHSLYGDLIGEFLKHEHNITVVSPANKQDENRSMVASGNHWKLIKPFFGQTQKIGFIRKGINVLVAQERLLQIVKKYTDDTRFDLVLYSTPPITLTRAVAYIKKRDGAKTILMLKDIFPQNSVDFDILATSGIRSLVYKFFRAKEKQLYAISDRIGCMSRANVEFIEKHNPTLPGSKLFLLVNSADPTKTRQSVAGSSVRKTYAIPPDAKLFFYGGNLGVPQGIPFFIECLKQNMNLLDRYFIICGQGTNYRNLESFIDQYQPTNVKLLDYLPKHEYDMLLNQCDAGLIFLDHRSTTPNCPARFYSYMEYSKPVIACTDTVCDIKDDIYAGEFGWWCESNDVKGFTRIVDEACVSDLIGMGKKAREYLERNYTTDTSYRQIMTAYESIGKGKTENGGER